MFYENTMNGLISFLNHEENYKKIIFPFKDCKGNYDTEAILLSKDNQIASVMLKLTDAGYLIDHQFKTNNYNLNDLNQYCVVLLEFDESNQVILLGIFFDKSVTNNLTIETSYTFPITDNRIPLEWDMAINSIFSKWK